MTKNVKKDIGKKKEKDMPDNAVKLMRGIKHAHVDLGIRTKNLRNDANLDPIEAYKLRKAGFSYARIGQLLACDGRVAFHETTVQHALDRLVGEDRKILHKKDYEITQTKVLAELLQKKHVESLKAITPNKLKRESARDNASTAKMLHEQIRLEGNKSTQNTAHSFIAIVEQTNKESGL